jgi:hypothetical protein
MITFLSFDRLFHAGFMSKATGFAIEIVLNAFELSSFRSVESRNLCGLKQTEALLNKIDIKPAFQSVV